MLAAGISTLDLVLVAVTCLFALRGALKGFTWQVIRFMAFAVAFACASLADDPLAPMLRSLFPSLGAEAAPGLAWAMVFFLVLLLGTWAAFLARGLVHGVALAGVDRLAGCVLGAATGVLCALLLVVVGGAWMEASGRHARLQQLTHGSRLLAPLGQVADGLGAYLPAGARGLWLEVRPGSLPGAPATAPVPAPVPAPAPATAPRPGGAPAR
ncbi:MAG: CvpA family protein [Planctomycetia bacterium]